MISYRHLLPSLILCCFLKANCLFGQEIERSVIGLAGGINSADYEIEWTIGQLNVITLSNQGITITQGFHQIDETITPLALGLNPIAVNVYPNPVSTTLYLSIPQSVGECTYQMFDLEGRVIFSGSGQGNLSLDMEGVAVGVHYIRLSNEFDFAKTLKISVIK